MQDVNLYKYMFAPDLQHQTLAIIGCLSVKGPQAPMMEMQCRLAAKVFKVYDGMRLHLIGTIPEKQFALFVSAIVAQHQEPEIADTINFCSRSTFKKSLMTVDLLSLTQ